MDETSDDEEFKMIQEGLGAILGWFFNCLTVFSFFFLVQFGIFDFISKTSLGYWTIPIFLMGESMYLVVTFQLYGLLIEEFVCDVYSEEREGNNDR